MKGQKYFLDAVARIPTDIGKRVDLSMSISDRISEILKERGMTQKDFAKGIGRSEAEVSRWLGGTHNFTISTLAKISAYLEEDIVKVM